MAELLELAAGIAAQARHGEEVEAYLTRGRTTTVRAHGGQVESLSAAESEGAGIRVVVDHRVGFASAGSLDPDVVAEALAEARDNAAFAEPDELAALASPDGVAAVDVDDHSAALLDLGVDAKVELALALERECRQIDPRIRGVRTAIYGDSIGEGAVATTTGIRAWDQGTAAHLSVTVLADDSDGGTQTGSGIAAAFDHTTLDPSAVAADAVERAISALGARKPPSRRVTVVLEPGVASSLLGVIGGALGADQVQRGRSPFADRVGETVAVPQLTVVDDPTDGRSLAARRYDDEGLASRCTALIDGGVLRGFLHSSYTGRRWDVPSTASALRTYRTTPQPGPQALIVSPGSLSFEELLAAVGEGVLVRSVSGLHSGVNPVSGDFSVGAAGLMIRGGTPAEPVREMTIASTLQRMLLDVIAVGTDVEWRPGGNGVPSIAIGDVSMSGA
ncbi:MAG: TldD/PmbA family protein [Actinomycetota bacterium]